MKNSKKSYESNDLDLFKAAPSSLKVCSQLIVYEMKEPRLGDLRLTITNVTIGRFPRNATEKERGMH
jgi:hypothetical protein